LLCLLAASIPSLARSQGDPAPPPPREANSTLKLPLDPVLLTYFATNAFPSLPFEGPVAVTSPPGETNQLFVVERAGRIVVITNLANPTRTVFLDLSSRVNSNYVKEGAEGLTSLAFHPGYATNRFFFVTYCLKTTSPGGDGNHNRLSRFQTSPANPFLGMNRSELPLITQFDEGYGHNFNDLRFGPDGYLYVAAGDEGDGRDQYGNSQRIDRDFFSAILRLDVDQRPGNLAPTPHPAHTARYSVPADNPFIGVTMWNGEPIDPARLRTEFYAIGLRNPWRMSFDPDTGLLYCGDVGQHAVEEINVIVKGGNYGWAYFEGSQKGFRGDPPAGWQAIPPIHEVRHGFGLTQGKTIIGGLVDRGSNIPALSGAYLFADYTSGHFWALRYDGVAASPVQWLMTDPGVASFGTDPRDASVLVVDQDEGVIKRLAARAELPEARLPPTLAETGAFADLHLLTVNAGIVPYDLNLPFWSDGADKQRWFSIPDREAKIEFHPHEPWSFPTGMVWIKHFEIELTNGVPESSRRLETRLLVRNSNGVYGVTYRWDSTGTNATLVEEGGADEPLLIQHDGLVRTQIWHYPGRTECLACHTSVGGYALGFNTAQLNRNSTRTVNVSNQIEMLSRAGYFRTEPTNVHSLPALADPGDESVSLEYRARSYLSANCVQCHQPGGPAPTQFDTRLQIPTRQANLIDGQLSRPGANTNSRVLKRGSIELSMIHSRMSATGPDRMPPLGSSVPDPDALRLFSAWITNDLPRFETYPEWRQRMFAAHAPAPTGETEDADGDGSINLAEFIAGTNPLDALDRWELKLDFSSGERQVLFTQPANRAYEIEWKPQLHPDVAWRTIQDPEHRRSFPATNRVVPLSPLLGTEEGYFRVKLIEP
jgi:glucose/arabinose dehydrogenase